MSAEPLIYVHDLCKDFRTFRRREGVWGSIQNLFVRDYRTVAAVDRVGFSIERGEMVGYIGPNGAGKSTTIKMLTGILVPTRGEIRVNGYVPFRQRRQYVKTIGVVFGQRTQLWWDIAVIESFKLLRRIYDVPQRDFDARMEHFNEILGISDYLHTPVRKLSLGERMRCDLAAALLHNPPLLFLDEPTIGLDVVAKDHIRHFLRAINREFHTTILLTTHDLDDIEELCRRIMIIDHGRVLFDGHLYDLKQKLLRTKQIKFALKDRDQVACLEVFAREGFEIETVDELTYRIRFDRVKIVTADLIRRILAAVEVRDLLIEDEPIEEIVKRIYAGEALPRGNGVNGFADALLPYAEFARVGFVNILAFRLRYFTGIITYFLNVTVYYFIWTAVFHSAHSIAGFSLPQIITYVSVGWMIRSFYWNTIDQEMAYEVIEGKIAMDLIKPVSIQWMWICRAMGESAFRLGLLTLPTAVVVALVFPVQGPASGENFALFLVSVLGSFFLMAAINFMIGTCAIPLKSILALIRAKYWLIEMLSGLLIPISFFPDAAQRIMARLPFEYIAFVPLQIYLGKLDRAAALRALGTQWLWVIAMLALAHFWWERASRKITIHGG